MIKITKINEGKYHIHYDTPEEEMFIQQTFENINVAKNDSRAILEREFEKVKREDYLATDTKTGLLLD